MRFSILLALVLSSVAVAQPAEREDKVDPLEPRVAAIQFTIEDKTAGRSFVWGRGYLSLILFESGRVLWVRTDNGREHKKYELGYSDIANAVFGSGFLFVFRSKSNSIFVHNAETGQRVHTFSPPEGVRFCAQSLCAEVRNKRCYIGATDGSVYHADLQRAS